MRLPLPAVLPFQSYSLRFFFPPCPRASKPVLLPSHAHTLISLTILTAVWRSGVASCNISLRRLAICSGTPCMNSCRNSCPSSFVFIQRYCLSDILSWLIYLAMYVPQCRGHFCLKMPSCTRSTPRGFLPQRTAPPSYSRNLSVSYQSLPTNNTCAQRDYIVQQIREKSKKNYPADLSLP